MKKLSTALVCVFLALVLVGVVVYPGRSLAGTIEAVKYDFAPVYNAFTYSVNFVRDVLLPQKVQEIPDVVYGGPYMHMKEFIESETRDFLISMGWYHEACEQDWNILTTFKTNIHEEHRVCLLKIEHDSGRYRFCYCAICNKVVAIYKVKAFQFYKDWVYPLVDGKITANDAFYGAYDLTFLYGDYIKDY